MSLFRTRAVLGALSLAALVAGAVAPAAAYPGQGYQGASDRSVWRVRHRLERDIVSLQHDRRDYRGYRVAAINEIQAARNELLAAEQFAHDRPQGGFRGAPGSRPGERGQMGSDRNLRQVSRDVERQYDRLANDANDYGGHKGAAMGDLRRARRDLASAVRYAGANGY